VSPRAPGDDNGGSLNIAKQLRLPYAADVHIDQ
jgi:hypothetical protein